MGIYNPFVVVVSAKEAASARRRFVISGSGRRWGGVRARAGYSRERRGRDEAMEREWKVEFRRKKNERKEKKS